MLHSYFPAPSRVCSVASLLGVLVLASLHSSCCSLANRNSQFKDFRSSELVDGGKTVVIVSDSLSTNLLFRVGEHVSKNLFGCGVRCVVAGRPLGTDVEVIVPEAGKLLSEQVACVVALVEMSDGSAVSYAGRTTILNTGKLRFEGDTSLQYAKRLERETIRLVGMSIGLLVCPFPRCALSEWRTQKELDFKGRNLCPPCHGRAEKIMLESGMIKYR